VRPVDQRSEIPANVPPGFCQCGCGARTAIAKKTDARHGDIKGAPRRFLNGHYSRGRCSPITAYRVDEETGCWLWTGTISAQNGYGHVKRRGTTRGAHVAVYEEHRGEVPDGLHLDHLCRVRHCVNPDHLEPVTPAENVRRSSTPKLTPDQVREIRASTDRVSDVATRYGINRRTVYRIKSRLRWSDLP
jgi:hypothetical protein